MNHNILEQPAITCDLEIGCGRGVGCELLFQRCGARQVCAIDLDPTMIVQACSRLVTSLSDRLQLEVGDVTKIPAPDGIFDAVFDFGILHHVPNRQAAVSEVRRFEEITRQALQRWVCRTWLEHPEENRFSADELIAEPERLGIVVDTQKVQRFRGDLLIGVGRVVQV